MYATLHDIPRLFQVWAYKQVMDIAGTNLNQPVYQTDKDPKCRSCDESLKSCAHVLHYPEEGRLDATLKTV